MWSDVPAAGSQQSNGEYERNKTTPEYIIRCTYGVLIYTDHLLFYLLVS